MSINCPFSTYKPKNKEDAKRFAKARKKRFNGKGRSPIREFCRKDRDGGISPLGLLYCAFMGSRD
jgi:hypothetical protein